LSGCAKTNLFIMIHIGWIFFLNFWKLLENIVGVWDKESLHSGSSRVTSFSKCFGNYWKILSGCETTNLFRQVLKDWTFSYIFENFRKLLENIVGVWDIENLHTDSYRVNYFRKFSEIIGKYYRAARPRISSDRFL